MYDFGWLLIAGGINDENVHNSKGQLHIKKDRGFATDGYRLHIVNDLPDNLNKDTTDKVEAALNCSNVLSEFSINVDYLKDALDGFDDCLCVDMQLVKLDSIWWIKITSDHSDNIALIACIDKDRGDNDD